MTAAVPANPGPGLLALLPAGGRREDCEAAAPRAEASDPVTKEVQGERPELVSTGVLAVGLAVGATACSKADDPFSTGAENRCLKPIRRRFRLQRHRSAFNQ